MDAAPIPFTGVKAIALAVTDRARARHFYVEVLGLPPAEEDGQEVGCWLATTVLMFKDPKEHWYGQPTDRPNPRLTLAVDSAAATERMLRDRGVTVSDPVARYGDALVGGFLDSEGNKLWFCESQ